MKRYLYALCAAVLVMAIGAIAGVDDTRFSVQTTGSGASATNSKRYVVNGLVEAVHVDVPASATGSVLVITADGQTIFSAANMTADGVYYPLTPGHFAGTTGQGNGATTNMVQFPVAGLVTGRVIGASFQTNTYIIRLITSD